MSMMMMSKLASSQRQCEHFAAFVDKDMAACN